MFMPRYTIHYTFLFLALTALTGVLMRFFMIFESNQFIPYAYLLHGHSHVAILGWTFLAVFIIFMKMNWEELIHKKQAIAIVITTLIVTVLMFFAFLYEGYALYSIILSTVHIGIEYWVIIFTYISLKTITKIPKMGKQFIKGALLMLFISSIGPFSLGAIASQGLRDSAIFEMTIYFYLHFQYNGWLYLFLIGLFITLLHHKKIFLPSNTLNFSFWIYFISLLPGYLLSILWSDVGLIGYVLACTGAIGQLAGVFLFLSTLLGNINKFKNVFSNYLNISFLFIFILLISKSVMELALLYPPLAHIIYDTRAVVIGYLHLTLLGFITVFILTMYQAVDILDERKVLVKNGIAVFLVGFILNEIILFTSGLLTWLGMTQFVLQNEFLLVSSLILFVGILIMWSSVGLTRRGKR